MSHCLFFSFATVNAGNSGPHATSELVIMAKHAARSCQAVSVAQHVAKGYTGFFIPEHNLIARLFVFLS